MAQVAGAQNGAMTRIQGRRIYAILDTVLLACGLVKLVTQCIYGVNSTNEIFNLVTNLFGLGLGAVILALLCARQMWRARTIMAWHMVALVVLICSVVLFTMNLVLHSSLLGSTAGMTTMMATGVLLACVTANARREH